MTLPGSEKSIDSWVVNGVIGVLGTLTMIFAGMIWANNSGAILEIKEQSRAAISDVRFEARTSIAGLQGDLKALNEKVINLEITINKLDARIQGLVDTLNKSQNPKYNELPRR